MKYLIVIFSLFSSFVFADDRPDVPEVMMGKYLVGSVSEFPALQTYGLATCIGVTLYDPVMRQGALLHVSASTNISAALNQALNDLRSRGTRLQNVQAQMHGGWDISMGYDDGMNYTSYITVHSLVSEFTSRQIPLIQNLTLVKKSDVDQGYPAIINIELNLASGDVFQYIQTVPYRGGDISRPMP